jgi:hypothetical protein
MLPLISVIDRHGWTTDQRQWTGVLAAEHRLGADCPQRLLTTAPWRRSRLRQWHRDEAKLVGGDSGEINGVLRVT